MPECWRRRREGISWRTIRWHARIEAKKMGGDDVQIFQTATYPNAIHGENKFHVDCFCDRLLLRSTAGRN